MKRKIKFRTWDGHTMYAIWNLLEGLNDKYHPFLGPYKEDTIFIQFTGLTDKNGNEIYEGDILSANIGIRVVEFAYGGFLASNPSEDDHIPLSDFLETNHEKEIIGNIYQTPSLVI
jgi:hypothetical protein